MSKPVRLAREARAELHEAARRYGEQRPELRIEFLAAIDETMERMVWLAKHLGSPPGIDPTLGINRVFVKRFPFSAYFIDLPTRFRVLTVAHGRRRPFHPAIRVARVPGDQPTPMMPIRLPADRGAGEGQWQWINWRSRRVPSGTPVAHAALARGRCEA